MNFDWDEHNIEHVGRKGLEPDGIEEAVLDPKRVPYHAHRSDQREKRSAVIGKTSGGHSLMVVLTVRDKRLRVVTARPANKTEKRLYRRK